MHPRWDSSENFFPFPEGQPTVTGTNGRKMNDWFHELPVPWMALPVFGITYLIALAMHAGVGWLARRGRGKSFKAVSPGMLPPLGIIFGLFVAFTAAQVWSDNDRANAAVSHEASTRVFRANRKPNCAISSKLTFMKQRP